MPIMPRMPGKAKKIAWAILGKPANMHPSSKRQREINQMLLVRTATQFSK